jgi:hypothetical protein
MFPEIHRYHLAFRESPFSCSPFPAGSGSGSGLKNATNAPRCGCPALFQLGEMGALKPTNGAQGISRGNAINLQKNNPEPHWMQYQ